MVGAVQPLLKYWVRLEVDPVRLEVEPVRLEVEPVRLEVEPVRLRQWMRAALVVLLTHWHSMPTEKAAARMAVVTADVDEHDDDDDDDGSRPCWLP